MIRYIIYSLLSSVIASSMLLLTNKILYALIIFIIFLVFFILMNNLFIKKQEKINQAQKDLYYFIHDFTIGYYHNYSIHEALDFSTLHSSYKLVEQVKLLSEYKNNERLERLTGYFNSPLYDLFYRAMLISKKGEINETINMINLINNKNILQLENIRRDKKKNLIKYCLLWLLAFIIAILLRVVIANQLSNNSVALIYLIGVIFFYFIFMFSNYLFITNYYHGGL